MKRIITLIILLAALGVAAYAYRTPIRDWATNVTREPVPEAVSFTNFSANANRSVNAPLSVNAAVNATPEPEPIVNAPVVEPPAAIPATFNLAVPFTSQAPSANWDEVHEDTCEEAALLMVHRFYESKTFTSAQDADSELLAMVDFQNARYGDFKSTSAEETATLIRDYYGYDRVEVVYDITIDDVKREVAQGRPVILLAAGRQLGNPNFKQPGPLYHALVVKGWTETEIITNDPGTRKGADYRYDPDVLMNAVHDWNDGDPANGRKVMIVMYP